VLLSEAWHLLVREMIDVDAHVGDDLGGDVLVVLLDIGHPESRPAGSRVLPMPAG
jgi:hypothetical protein